MTTDPFELLVILACAVVIVDGVFVCARGIRRQGGMPMHVACLAASHTILVAAAAVRLTTGALHGARFLQVVILFACALTIYGLAAFRDAKEGR